MPWRLNNVSIRLPASDGWLIDALINISLTIAPGDHLAIVGPNGSGKSTLARTLAGLLALSEGRITVDHDGADQMAALVFQGPEDNLIAETVQQEIELSLEHSKYRGESPRSADQLLDEFGLSHLKSRPIQRLSGGEKQKLAIACVLASGRSLIILDEPTSHLDPPGRRDLLSRLLGLRRIETNPARQAPAVVLITQYPEDARQFPRIVALESGRVTFDGPPHAWSGLPGHAEPHTQHVSEMANAPILAKATNLTQLPQSNWPLSAAPLRDVNLQIRAGDAIGLVGPIGCGKSTLGYHLAGLFESFGGTLETAWTQQPSTSPALMIQFPERQLFCSTVGEDVAFGPLARGQSHSEALALATDTLAALGLSYEEFSHRSPFDLSAGQQRRVGMAGVAACPAPLYILDEPTAALDADGLARLETLLAKWRQLGTACLIISHDLDWLSRVTRRAWVMNAGRLIFDGTWSESLRINSALQAIGFIESP